MSSIAYLCNNAAAILYYDEKSGFKEIWNINKTYRGQRNDLDRFGL
jgi:hypothetical protein